MIDRIGVIKMLKVKCIVCNIYEEIGKKTRCEDCPFCKNSKAAPGRPSRIGISRKYFRPLGFTVKQCQLLGKHQVFMYLYYEHLNWEAPPIPDFDNFGFPVKPNAKQSIHHINGNHYDDRKQNLTWKLLSDHSRDEQLNNNIKREQKKSIYESASILGIKIN